MGNQTMLMLMLLDDSAPVEQCGELSTMGSVGCLCVIVVFVILGCSLYLDGR